MDLKKCSVCSDTREVKKHYGVSCCYGCKSFFRRTINENKKYYCINNNTCIIDKDSRNRCRSCRFNKCILVGMNESNLRDFKSKPSLDPPTLSELKNGKPSTSNELHLDKKQEAPIDKHVRNLEAVKLIDFLRTMTSTTLYTFDPKYTQLSPSGWEELDKNYGRNVSLSEGLKNPERVCPRTKWDWSYSRKAEIYDISFMWYRFFVCTADWANSIPQFRMLPESDQLDLVKLNFVNISMLFLMYFTIDQSDFNLEYIPMGNGSYVLKDDSTDVFSKLIQQSLDAYEIYLFRPAIDLEIDLTELCILASIRLFQYHENLSDDGKKISDNYLDQLYDALFEYQYIRYQNTSYVDRNRRQNKLLMVTSRISQIWAMESDIHLMLSTFSGMNIDGIPKQLLFSDFEPKRI